MARTFNDFTLIKIVVMEGKKSKIVSASVHADVLKSKNKVHKSSIIYWINGIFIGRHVGKHKKLRRSNKIFRWMTLWYLLVGLSIKGKVGS